MSDAAAPIPQAIRLRALLAGAVSAPPRSSTRDQRDEAFAAGRAAADAEWQLRFDALEATLYAARDTAAAREAELSARARAAADALQTALSTELSRLAIEIAGRILEVQPGVAAETLAALIHEALSATVPGDVGTLRVNPAALESATAQLPAGWAVLPDPSLAVGEVLAEAGPVLALASLANRLVQATAALGRSV
jgi:flagellar biosynthesis/type III secretory pathway protein FliH